MMVTVGLWNWKWKIDGGSGGSVGVGGVEKC